MKPIFASFTPGESRIIVFVFVTLAIGCGIVEWKQANQTRLVFQADDRPQPVVSSGGFAAVPDGLDPATGLVDVNQADEELLQTLPGVGPSTAAAIREHRETHGAFAGVDDLDRVPGIGPSKIARLAPRITFGSAPVVTGARASSMPVAPVVSADGMAMGGGGGAGGAGVAAPLPAGAASTDGRININTAGEAELQRLNGVGPALAQRIIEDRQQRGAFRSPADLDRVRGIGQSILTKNAHLITVH